MAGSISDDEEEELRGFGLRSLWKTTLFVTLWWALWSLYDFYLTPYAPWPELAILAVAAGYSAREDAKLREPRVRASATSTAASAAPWPCTSDGCLAEDSNVADEERVATRGERERESERV